MSKRLSKQQKQARRQKKKDKSARKRKTESRRAIADLIKRLGLWDAFTQLPERMQALPLGARNPLPKIVLAEDSEEDLDLASSRADIERWYRLTSIQLPSWPFEIPLDDCCRSAMPLMMFYGALARISHQS